MTTKPMADVTRTTALLRQRFADDVVEVRPLAGGVFSRAYAFTTGGLGYVIRLNTSAHAAEGFAKDDYAWRHFASPALPIPRVVLTGQAGEVQFAISKLVPGRTLEALSPDERRAALPALLDTLDAIAQADVSASQGYGDWGGDGQGRYARWHDYLTAIIENESAGFYQAWHVLFHESCLERDAYEAIYWYMLRLAAHCPEERALLHNDYWFENVLAAGKRITGVIDWANALYGDPLYDIARLNWGSAWPGWWYEDGAAFLRARYGATPGYTERIACYECHIGLDDLRYYAKMGMRAQYERTRDRLLARVASAAGDR